MSDTPALTLTREETILLLTCRPELDPQTDAQLGAVLRAPVVWEEVVWRAESLRTVPLLWHHLNRLGAQECLPNHIAHYLDTWSRVSRVRSQLMLDELGALLDGLNGGGVAYMLIKGSSIAPALYPDPLLRPMLDLDVLVEPSHVPWVRQFLHDRGYIHAYWDADTNSVVPVRDAQLVEYQTEHYELPVFMRLAQAPLDVEGSVIPGSWRRKHLKFHIDRASVASFPLFVDVHVNLSLQFDLKDVWHDVLWIDVLDRSAPSQSPAVIVWFLAARLYNEAFQLNVCKLSMLADLHLVLDRWAQSIDWHWVETVTAKYGMHAAVFYVLAQLRNLGATVPPDVLERLRPDRLGFPAAHDWGDVLPKLLGRTLVHQPVTATG